MRVFLTEVLSILKRSANSRQPEGTVACGRDLIFYWNAKEFIVFTPYGGFFYYKEWKTDLQNSYVTLLSSLFWSLRVLCWYWSTSTRHSALFKNERRCPFRFFIFCLSSRSGVGVTGAKQTMFYAEVSDDNCVSPGGGEPNEGELIEVVKVPLHEAMTFAYDERIPKTMGVIFSFIWFHNNMSPKYKISTNV